MPLTSNVCLSHLVAGQHGIAFLFLLIYLVFWIMGGVLASQAQLGEWGWETVAMQTSWPGAGLWASKLLPPEPTLFVFSP